MFRDFYPAVPPAGTNPPQSQMELFSSPQYSQPPRQYPAQQPYQPPYPTQPYQEPIPYGYSSQSTYIQQYPQQYPTTPQRPFQPAPPEQGGFYAHPPERCWDPKQIWDEYNHPPDPQYGVPENQRGQIESGDLVKPERRQVQPGQEGERGLGATVLGGGAGAFLGHKALKNHGMIGTIGGLVLGAIAANAYEYHEKEKKEHQREERAFDSGYEDGREKDRGIEDGYYDGDRTSYEDDYYEDRPRHHHHHPEHDYDVDYDDGESYHQDDYRQEDYYRRDDY